VGYQVLNHARFKSSVANEVSKLGDWYAGKTSGPVEEATDLRALER
jgi:hypothetical protein